MQYASLRNAIRDGVAESLSHVPLFVTPMDCSPPGSSVHGILQARILGWVAISFSRGFFLIQGSKLHLLHWQEGSLPLASPGKPGLEEGLSFLKSTTLVFLVSSSSGCHAAGVDGSGCSEPTVHKEQLPRVVWLSQSESAQLSPLHAVSTRHMPCVVSAQWDPVLCILSPQLLSWSSHPWLTHLETGG